MSTKSFCKRFFYTLVLILAVFGNGLSGSLSIPVASAAQSQTIMRFIHQAMDKAFVKFGFKDLKDDAVVGGLKGELKVTPTGNAQYSIKIDVPPGTNKMQPALAITYSSHQGNRANNLLGMGFTLAGLTSITRCSSDIYHNGEIHGVDYTDQDRFCLSGQQLVAVKGTYGQDGTEYRTYNDTQSRIISHKRQGNGPAYFTVETKGGLTAIYGGTPDSQNKAQGTDTVAVWGLNRSKDSVGNYLDVKYIKDETVGRFHPSEIHYTGNEKKGTPTYNAVQLIYEDRPDVRVTYQAGSKITLDQRLKEIKVLQANNVVYDYKLTYGDISPNTYRSRLASIQKCDGGGLCLPPTKFSWQTNEAGWEPANYKMPDYIAYYYDGKLGKNSNNGLRFIDLNGDGLMDIIQHVYFNPDDAHNKRHVWLNTGAGWTKDVTETYKDIYLVDNYYWGPGKASDNGFRVVDIDGNGLSDVAIGSFWAYGERDNEVWLSTGINVQSKDDYLKDYITDYKGDANTDNGDSGFRFVDLNGDGLPDASRCVYWDSKTKKNDTWINTGTGWQENSDYKSPAFITYYNNGIGKAGDNGFRFIDLNGDGLTDIARKVHWDDKHHKNDTWINTGKGWQENNQYAAPDYITYYGGDSSTTNGDNGLRFIDLNGDGLPDVVRNIWLKKEGHKNDAWLNTGAGWIKANGMYKLPDLIAYYSHKPGLASDNGLRFVDLNGDGLLDIVCANYWNYGDRDKSAWINGYQIDPQTNTQWQVSDAYRPPVHIVNYRGGDDTYNGDNGVRFVDVNGDGLPDLIQAVRWGDKKNNSNKIWFNKAKKYPDYLISITDGLGVETTIDYEPLSGIEVKVYEPETNPDGSIDSHYPNPQWVGPMYVVYQTASNTNITDPQAKDKFARGRGMAKTFPQSPYSTVPSGDDGTQHLTTYHYKGARINKHGLGFLGFHKVTTTDSITGISKITTYGQDPTQHNVGKILGSETYDKDGLLIHSLTNDWQVKTFGDGSVNNSYYLTYVKTAAEKGYSLVGKLLSIKTVAMSFDDYANPTEVTHTITDATGANSYATHTIHTYKYIIDANHWIPGQLLKSSVTASAPDVPNETHTSIFTYDDTGLLMSETTEPDDPNLVLTKSYKREDGFGNITQVEVTSKGIDRITSYQYDAQGRFKIKMTNALGQSVHQTSDPRFGKPATRTDLNGLVTTYGYDGFGRVISKTNPDQTNSKISYYWIATAILEVKDAVYAEHIQTTGHPDGYKYYDRHNRLLAQSTMGFDGLRNVWKTTQYNELDLITSASLPYLEDDKRYYTINEYDVLGRVTKTTKPDGGVVQMVYDGLTTHTINPLKQVTTKTTDVRGNILRSVDASGHAVTFKYDAFGRLLSMTDSKGNTTTMKYDKLGNKLSEQDPDKGFWQYKYDVLGEMIQQTDALGNVTILHYDKLGRMIGRTDGQGTSTWTYGNDPQQHNVGLLIQEDGVANLEQTADGVKIVAASPIDILKARKNGIHSYSKAITYDKYARPETTTTTIDGNHYTTTIQYDDASRVWKITYPNDIVIQNNYNPQGYLASITDANNITYWQLNMMDAEGRVIKETHSNGLVTDKTYNPESGLLTEIHTYAGKHLALQQKVFGSSNKPTEVSSDMVPANTDVQELTYQYDLLGNVKNRQDKVNSITEIFDYDDLNRLTDWKITSKIISSTHYDYDELGNMTYQSGVGHYTYGKPAGPHAVTSIANDQKIPIGKYSYDANGNQITGVLNGNKRTITYTSYEKPLMITGSGGQINFYYDANRHQFMRIDQVQQGGKNVLKTQLSLGNYMVETRSDGQSTTTRQKIYVGPYTEIVTENNTTNVFELLKDSLGSTMAVVDSGGNVLQRYHYDPFGKQNLILGVEHELTHKGFTGHQEIESFNLIHMKGRIYDPIICRFLSADPYVQDPTNTQSLNRYSYCVNNPLALTDPTGFGWWHKLIHHLEHFFHEIGHALESIFENRFFQMAVEILMQFVPGLQGWTLALCEGFYSAFNTALAGGDIGDVLQAGLIAGFSAEFNSLTQGLSASAFGGTQWLEGVALHSLEGGGIRVIEGGSFANGFLTSAVMQVAAAPIASIDNSDSGVGGMLIRATADGIVAGSVAAATGGDFGDAAETAAFSHLFSECAHRYEEYRMEQQHEAVYKKLVHQAVVAKHQAMNTTLTGKQMVKLVGNLLLDAVQHYLGAHRSLNFNNFLGLGLGGECDLSLTGEGLKMFLGLGAGVGLASNVNGAYTIGHHPISFTSKTAISFFGSGLEFAVGGRGPSASIFGGTGVGFKAETAVGKTSPLASWSQIHRTWDNLF